MDHLSRPLRALSVTKLGLAASKVIDAAVHFSGEFATASVITGQQRRSNGRQTAASTCGFHGPGICEELSGEEGWGATANLLGTVRARVIELVWPDPREGLLRRCTEEHATHIVTNLQAIGWTGSLTYCGALLWPLQDSGGPLLLSSSFPSFQGQPFAGRHLRRRQKASLKPSTGDRARLHSQCGLLHSLESMQLKFSVARDPHCLTSCTRECFVTAHAANR